ncbi:MAG TPA: efflux RND transporter permease subunit [Steroidobacteraceae bacterium]|nr:efflux RND transporter permease subunit [Steroidobacteraceae bacterium]
MWIVRLALNRPYTFIVLAIVIVLLGGFTIARTATDIFPNINIPIISTIWSYGGLPPDEMATRVVSGAERSAQVTVNDVEHTESQSLNGIAVVKYFFQPQVNEELAYSQITGVSQTLLRQAPPGTTPPFVLAYNASSVPILQLALDSPTLSEAQLFDLANTVIRPGLTTVRGASMPFPSGGVQRQIQVDLDPAALRARGLSASDVSSAMGEQNLIIPAGVQKIGDTEYDIKLNSMPLKVEALNNIPIRTVNGVTTFVRDVANVRDGSGPQTNLARVNGHHSVLMTVLKTGSASTIDIIEHIKRLLPRIEAGLPDDLKINVMNDQSLFVRGAVNGVIREGILAAALTGLMILLFLGSWRSTLIITISIPLSVLTSIICLSALGETINIMTLGGLALAVGILVDDATVAIENINWHLEHGKDVESAILDGAQQIAVPALVSTLCICIVFVPMFLLTGVSKFLFVPLAEAVVFAMLASYVLSRTLVPTLAKYWLRLHVAEHLKASSNNIFIRIQHGFERRFTAFRSGYHDLLRSAMHHRWGLVMVFMVIGLTAVPLWPWLGRDFFPSVDGGEIKLHLRARSGTRIDETAQICDAVEDTVRQVIPANELQSIADNIGLPYSGINLSYSTSAPVGPGDADIFIALNKDHHPTENYVRQLRTRLQERFPSVSFAFLPADIVSQILNFGLPAPLDIQIVGRNADANREVARQLLVKLKQIPGAVDLRIQQPSDHPQLNVTVDRVNAATLGITQNDVATNLLISLSGSHQTAPTSWIDPKSGIQYNITVQAPQYRLNSIQDLAATPITGGNSHMQLLSNLASITRSTSPAVVSHYNALPVIDIYGSVSGTDLNSVATRIHALVQETEKELPKGSHIDVRGQIETMRTSFSGLAYGMIGAVLLIYLLIVVNFQSWLDPLIIISALPSAAAGMVWMLFVTHTTVSVPALIGAIMCMGVATANSILVVSFARERLNAGLNAAAAAVEAGFVRLRPVLMTAFAMIIGMVPMALGLGEGSEQNAPLGRAVIGGLLFATFATLIFVPVVFAIVHGRRHTAPAHSGDAYGT